MTLTSTDNTVISHSLIELHECSLPNIDDLGIVKSALLNALQSLNFEPGQIAFHESDNCSVVNVISSEINITMHVWKEHSYVVFDVYLYQTDIYKTLQLLADALSKNFVAKRELVKEVSRKIPVDDNLKDFSVSKFESWADEVTRANPIIIDKVSKACEVNENEALELLIEALRYLNLVAHTGQRLTPSLLVDYAWHEFILCTNFYKKFCLEKFGRFIHHHPGGRTQETINKFRKTIQFYILYIGKPSKKYWGEIASQEWESSQCGSCISN